MFVEPKFLFGLKGDVRNNVHYLDDNIVLYPCGHNVVIYAQDSRVQRYIPGIEGTEGITAIAVSHDKKTLAVCEKSMKAVCSVYSLQKFIDMVKDKSKVNMAMDPANFKKRKILVSADYEEKEFIAVAFS